MPASAQSQTQTYEYTKYSYLLSDDAYNAILLQAKQAQYVHSLKVSRGLSDFINSVTLQPNFTDEELQVVEGSKLYRYSNPIWLNGNYRYPRKIALTNEQRITLAQIGLKYKLFERQPTDTALISGTLEAWGNGKFIARLNKVRTHLPTRGVHMQTLGLTRKQNIWLYHTACQMMYETNSTTDKHRGFNAFVQDFRFVDFEPYPFDPSIEDPDPNVPPRRLPDEEIYLFNFRTSPNLQGIFERDLYVPRLPGWYDCLPEPLNPEINTLKAATL